MPGPVGKGTQGHVLGEQVAERLFNTLIKALGLSESEAKDRRLRQALGGAAAAVVLAASTSSIFRLFGFQVPIARVVPGGLLILIGWVILTVAYSRLKDAPSELPRLLTVHLAIASSSLTATLFLIILAYFVFPMESAESERLLMMLLLPPLVVTHGFGFRAGLKRKTIIVLVLLLTNGSLALWSVMI